MVNVAVKKVELVVVLVVMPVGWRLQNKMKRYMLSTALYLELSR